MSQGRFMLQSSQKWKLNAKVKYSPYHFVYFNYPLNNLNFGIYFVALN
jgi:hypothetical protein